MLLGLNALAHLLTDAVCASALFGVVKGSAVELSWALIIYNTAAFTTQCLVGLGTDRLRRHERLAALGLAVCAAAALLPLPGYLLALVIGLGNSLFHVAGGTVTLKGARDAGPLGVFVAPGAVGLALGTLWPGLRGALCAAALVTAAALVFAGRGEPELQFPEGRKDTPWGAVLLLTLAVAVRAVGGCAVEFPWKTGAGMAMLAAAFVFAGKTLGGFACPEAVRARAQPPATTPRRRRCWAPARTALWSIPLAAALTAFCFTWAAPSLAGQLLLNLSMPVTLWLIYRAMPGQPGLRLRSCRLGALAGQHRGRDDKPYGRMAGAARHRQLRRGPRGHSLRGKKDIGGTGMKKLRAALLTALSALILAAPAFADVIFEPEPEPGSNAPLVAAIVIVAVVAVILAAVFVKKRRNRK